MFDAIDAPPSSAPYFADRLKELRQRLVGKQLCMSFAVGCTDAAVSFWETGKRLPARGSLFRILDVLAQGGASPNELASLLRSWTRAKGVRPPRGTYARI